MSSKPSTSQRTKRKSTVLDEDEAVEVASDVELNEVLSPSPSPSPPPKKKAKKEITPKVAVWKDIPKRKKKEKKAGSPVGKLPGEILDQIISIDSDLDLRDHLALAGTCRFFIEMVSIGTQDYEQANHALTPLLLATVVFQVLFQSSVPFSKHLLFPPHYIRVSPSGEVLFNPNAPRARSTLFQSFPFFEGPRGRSHYSARSIFSSTTPLEDGWGVSNAEWEEGEEERMNGVDSWRRILLDALVVERTEFELNLRKGHAMQLILDVEAWETKIRKFAGEKASRSNFVVGMGARPTALKDEQVEVEVKKLLERQREVYGGWIDPSYASSNQSNEQITPRDPWFSPWRKHVSDLVNNVLISKTEAKAIFKVTDRELLSLPLKSPAGSVKKYYSKAAVEALALRAHGGAQGHAEHKEKLRRKAQKAENTKMANWTYRYMDSLLFEGEYNEFSE